MGTENKIEFGSGTLYVGCIPDGHVDPDDFETTSTVNCGTCTIEWDEASRPGSVTRVIKFDDSVEFTGTCDVKFKGLVMLMGFWPAVKWTVAKWLLKLRNLWWALRTPLEDEE